MKKIIAFIIAGLSAYSFSFAADLLFGGLLGVYPSTVFLPVVTWSVIATITVVIAWRLAPTGRFLVIPFVALALLALIGGIVGHRHSLFVSLVMVGQAIGVWLGTAPAKAPVKRKTSTPTHPSFQVGAYRLGMRLNNSHELTEFTSAEYGVFGRDFRAQVNYHAPPVTFFDMTWKLMIGTVNGEIFKLAPYLELRSKDEANKAAWTALSHCRAELGEPSQQKTGLFIWDTTDGNVILQTAEGADGFAVNVFLNSSAVRSYQRL